jgi:uncharacterized membrane protein YgcG
MTTQKRFFRFALVLSCFGSFTLLALAQKPNPDRKEVTPNIVELQQMLTTLGQVRGMKPEDVLKLVEKFAGKMPNLQEIQKGNLGPAVNPMAPPPNVVPKPDPAVVEQSKPAPMEQRPMQINPEVNQHLPPGQDAGKKQGLNEAKENLAADNFKDKLKEHPGLDGMAKFWEQNFGSLEKTPAVKQALIELFEMSKDGDFQMGDWKKMMDEFKIDGNLNGNGDEFANWFKDFNLNMNGDWAKGDWGKGNWNFGKLGNFNWGGGGGAGGGGGGGWFNFNGGGISGSGGGSWLPVILFVSILAIGLGLFLFWPMLKQTRTPAEIAVRAVEKWPVDPRTINSREQLVKAFEYLSVLLCGDAARVWNHETIATALRIQIPSSELIADELASLYEIARYTPPGVPLTEPDLRNARRCLCELAGVNV